jgi:hypothetical protein
VSPGRRPLISEAAFVDARDALVLRGELSMVGRTLMLREQRNGELLNVDYQLRRNFHGRPICLIVVPLAVSAATEP